MLASIVGSDGTMTIYIGGKSYTACKDHPNYNNIKSLLSSKAANREKRIAELIDIPTSLKVLTKGHAQVVDGKVMFNGKEMNNSLTNRILKYMNSGFPFEHMLRFLENIMLNPIEESKEALYIFLENKALPITDDGCFLGYKNVQKNYKDWYSGTIDNSIGKKMPMLELNQVDKNRHKECSFGYHVGTLGYISTFHNGESKTVIVKVNPAHVVSVPSDANAQKIRVRTYEVVADYKQDLEDVLYTVKTEPYVEQPKVVETKPVRALRLYEVNTKKLGKKGDIWFWLEMEDGKYQPLDENKKALHNNWYYQSQDSINDWLKDNQIFLHQTEFGTKPDGRKYYNHRVGGKFAKKG